MSAIAWLLLLLFLMIFRDVLFQAEFRVSKKMSNIQVFSMHSFAYVYALHLQAPTTPSPQLKMGKYHFPNAIFKSTTSLLLPERCNNGGQLSLLRLLVPLPRKRIPSRPPKRFTLTMHYKYQLPWTVLASARTVSGGPGLAMKKACILFGFFLGTPKPKTCLYKYSS